MKKQKENSHEGITWSEMGKQKGQLTLTPALTLKLEIGSKYWC